LYRNSKFWKEINHYSEGFPQYKNVQVNLSDYNVKTLIRLLEILEIKIDILFSSDLKVEGGRNQKLINICKKINGDIYICGEGGKSYLDNELFLSQDILVYWHSWDEQYFYSQYGNIMWRNVSFIDFIARYGINELKKVLIIK